jgi:predicted permease
MDWLRYDVRAALRELVRRPGLSLVIILTLAAGLGVNAVAFSAVDALFFASTRIPNAERLGWVFPGETGNAGVSMDEFRHLRDHTRTLTGLAAEGRRPVSIGRDTATERAWALVVSENYFSLMPATPAAGRLLVPADASAPGVPVVVSERFWRDRFGAAPDLAALDLDVARTAVTVVGVVPDDFQGPGGLFAPDLWVPLSALASLDLPPSPGDAEWLTLVGERDVETTAAAIEAELLALMSTMPGATDRDPAGASARFVPLLDGHPDLAQGLPQIFTIVVVSMSLLLLVASFNVAGLSLARALERQRDIAVRAALGASPWRLIRAMLTESVVMTLAAAAAGLLLVGWAESLLGFFSLPAPIPQRLRFGMSGRLLAVMGVLVVAATTLPVLVPAWQVRRRDATSASRLTVRGAAAAGRAPRHLFVRVQVAGSMLFVALGLVVIQSFAQALAFDPGFDPARIGVLQLSPALASHDAESSREAVRRVLARLEGDPALEAVAAADRVPFYVGYPDARAVSPESAPCAPADCDEAVNYAVTSGFFDAMGVPLTAGRTFNVGSAADSGAVVINQTAADRFWPGGRALGQSFREGEDRLPRTVVGIVPAFAQRGIDETPRAVVYRPLTDEALGNPVTVIARARGDGATALPALVDAVRAADPALPPGVVQTMRDRMALPLWFPRVIAGFFGFTGLLAIVLATVGLFGSSWYAVSRRTQEFGVRLAVGASAPMLRRLVVREGVMLALPGLLVGLGIAIGLVALGRSSLVGVNPAAPGLYLAAVALQLGAVVAANWWPARRAARVDPIRALAAE